MVVVPRPWIVEPLFVPKPMFPFSSTMKMLLRSVALSWILNTKSKLSRTLSPARVYAATAPVAFSAVIPLRKVMVPAAEAMSCGAAPESVVVVNAPSPSRSTVKRLVPTLSSTFSNKSFASSAVLGANVYAATVVEAVAALMPD